MKLSKAQQRVVDLMKEGWELAYDNRGFYAHCWLQKGGTGKGGPTEKVNFNTLYALKNRGIVKNLEREGFGLNKFVINRKVESTPTR